MEMEGPDACGICRRSLGVGERFWQFGASNYEMEAVFVDYANWEHKGGASVLVCGACITEPGAGQQIILKLVVSPRGISKCGQVR
ncbi:MAG: hypothetical protein WD557_01085 [Dehalococcoidia bacterium]